MKTSVADDTIFALSSAAGRAGVAVIRLSGPRSGQTLEALVGDKPKPRLASLRALRAPNDGTVIDNGLVLWFPAPASYTGEDTAEMHIHGGRAVIDAVLDVLGGQAGLRMAQPGEFTRRAFLNGKLDLTEAEGIADLIDAQTEAQRRQAMRQAGGALQALYEGWRYDLIEAMALIEAALDFSDEGDVPTDAMGLVEDRLRRLATALDAHLNDGRRGEILRDGLHIVLAGAPNAGKSSLLNRLALRDAAIVSTEAGTTRDIIEVRLDLGGYPIILSDTAGVREAQSPLEAEGIRRTLAHTRTADLVVWVMDAANPVSGLPDAIGARPMDVRWVANKSDLLPTADARKPIFGPVCVDPPVGARGAGSDRGRHATSPLPVSALTGQGIDQLASLLAEAAHDRLGDSNTPPPSRARHRLELVRCADAIASFLRSDPTALELRAEDLRIAASALGRITGRIDVEDILDRVFAEFCIGK